ncbi:MAG: methyltransferase domain-containing protein [Candidatus Daviesbacteria bacterium]|nr:methyltransferase domain-containing protein [Candidatus Daviesbacteria bacterium]
MVELDSYLEVEAHAWEDNWQKGVSKKSLEAYKKNMQIFKKLGFWEESGEAAKLIPSRDDFIVLDLACGNGLSTAHIKGSLVVGLDLSESQLEKAKKRFKDKDFVVGDARKLPFKDNSFDLIVAINMLHHIEETKEALNECMRVLKKGGVLLTVDPNLYNPIGFIGRGLFRLLNLKNIFPTFPQFALGEKERQFSKGQYYQLFKNSKFKKFEIIPHRIERILFFSTILFPALINLPFYEQFLIGVSKLGNKIVKIAPFDYICYFWIGKATK